MTAQAVPSPPADPGASKPPDRWVERRVHGVSGSTAESFLGCRPPPHRAADDEDKRSEFLQCEDADPAGDETGRTLEEFRWGNYTSGSPRNALWLLLLPFAVINATQFMIYRPWTATILAEAAYAVASALLRLLGLASRCCSCSVSPSSQPTSWRGRPLINDPGGSWPRALSRQS